MSLKGAALLLSAALTTLGAACLLLGSDRIGEEQAARYAEANHELAATLPVPAGTELVSEEQTDCSGSRRQNATEACALRLVYQTREPLRDVLALFDGFFLSHGWTPLERNSELSAYYRKGKLLVQVGVALGIPHGACPDGAVDPEANRQCLRREVARDDGNPRKYDLVIAPD